MKKKLSIIVTAIITGSMLLSIPAVAYSDTAGQWYTEAVEHVTSAGLFNGTGDGSTFSPDGEMTRAMFVKVLYSFQHADNLKYLVSFSDVEEGQWYTDAVGWAYKNGIVNGKDNNKFDPNGSITRQEMCVMTANYLKFLSSETGKNLTNGNVTYSFSDSSTIASWAKDSVEMCASLGLVQGSDGSFNPTNTVTRAQAAVVFGNELVVVADKLGITENELISNGPIITEKESSTASSTNGDSTQIQSGSATGGSSTTGGSTSGSGSASSGDSKTEHSAEEETMISYFQNIVNNYDSAVNGYTSRHGENISVNVESALNEMKILCTKAINDHASGKVITSDYVQNAYSSDISVLRTLKSSMSNDDISQFETIVSPAMELSSHFLAILDYFGVSY